MGEPPTAPGQRGAATTERCREDGRQGIWAFSGRLPRGALTRDPHWLDAPGVVPRPHLTLRPEPEGDARVPGRSLCPESWEHSGARGRGEGTPAPTRPSSLLLQSWDPEAAGPAGRQAPAFHKPLPGPEGWRCPGSQHRQVDEPESQAGRGHPKIRRRGQRPSTDRRWTDPNCVRGTGPRPWGQKGATGRPPLGTLTCPLWSTQAVWSLKRPQPAWR